MKQLSNEKGLLELAITLEQQAKNLCELAEDFAENMKNICIKLEKQQNKKLVRMNSSKVRSHSHQKRDRTSSFAPFAFFAV